MNANIIQVENISFSSMLRFEVLKLPIEQLKNENLLFLEKKTIFFVRFSLFYIKARKLLEIIKHFNVIK